MFVNYVCKYGAKETFNEVTYAEENCQIGKQLKLLKQGQGLKSFDG